jgi:hypothetical protein
MTFKPEKRLTVGSSQRHSDSRSRYTAAPGTTAVYSIRRHMPPSHRGLHVLPSKFSPFKWVVTKCP